MEQTRREFLASTAVMGSTAFLFSGCAEILREAGPMERAAALAEATGYTYCDGCNHVPKCGMVYTRRGPVITRVESRTDFNYPNNTLCSKGYAQLQEQYHPERLRYPLKRTTAKGQPPRWVRISWEEAMRTAGRRLTELRSKYGAETVCFYTGDPKEMRPPLQRLALSFGSPNFGTESSTCFRSSSLAGLLTFGETVMGNPPTQGTKYCFIWGVNQSYSMATAMKGLIKANGAGVKYVIIDPRKSPLVRALDGYHLPLRPGTDGALALGMLHVVIAEKRYDQEFVARWVHGFDELAEYVKQFTPERAAKITGVAPEQIRVAARAFAEGPTTFMISASPVVHHTNGNQNVRAILSLVAITGNFDRPGGVPVPPPAALPPDFLGHPVFTRRAELQGKLASKRVDLKDFPAWAELIPEIQMNRLPEYVDQGRIRAMLLFGGNAKMWPQPHLYQKALGKMEFSLAVDYFYRPWTHDYVDLLLPAATCFERLAPAAVFGRNIYQRQPVAPLGEAREDWQIIADIGVACGLRQEFFDGNLEAFVDEYYKPAGVTVAGLRAAPGAMSQGPAQPPMQFKKYAAGLMRPDKKPGFNTPTGKVELSSTILKKHGFDPLPTYKEPKESPVSMPEAARRFPLVLMTGARIPFYTHSKWRDVPWVADLQPEPVVNLNPRDAAARGLREGDPVVVENAHGKIRVKAHLTEMVSAGMVDIYHGWPEQDVNTMITRDFDPISGFPPYKSGLCQVRKA